MDLDAGSFDVVVSFVGDGRSVFAAANDSLEAIEGSMIDRQLKLKAACKRSIKITAFFVCYHR